MVRIAGAIMIISGCLGLGLWYRQQFIHRLQVLRKLAEILELLMSEIRYGKATLPECCRHMAGHLQEPYAGCLQTVSRKMQENTGASFTEVFRFYMNECLEGLPIKEEDREQFLHFASENSFAEGKMQLRTLEQSREQLGNTIRKLEHENGEKCRMAMGLGAMSGLLLVIVLL